MNVWVVHRTKECTDADIIAHKAVQDDRLIDEVGDYFYASVMEIADVATRDDDVSKDRILEVDQYSV
jgi:hypothetical protein